MENYKEHLKEIVITPVCEFTNKQENAVHWKVRLLTRISAFMGENWI